jgi:uncharacterized protein (UPF0548 family)
VPDDDLARRPLGYDCVGATRVADDAWEAPPGYRRFEGSALLGRGEDVFRAAAEAVLRWEVKTRSGFSVHGDRPVSGTRLWITGHVGPLSVAEPAVVVDVVDRPDRVGFSYGTLRGHPISGEEAFVVRRDADDAVWFTLRSVSRRPSGAWSAAYPLVLLVQRVYRRRYLRALH